MKVLVTGNSGNLGAESVIAHYHPELLSYFYQQRWKVPNSIDRVYAIMKAEQELKYFSKYDILKFLESLKS